MSTSKKNTNKNVSVSMLSYSDKQEIQSLAIKPLLSQLPGRHVFTVFYLNTGL